MDVTLTFNRFDFAPRVSDYRIEYETKYRKVVTALDGTEYAGNGTRRPIVTFMLLPMTDTQAAQCYNALSVMVATCTYTDTATNTDRSVQMRVTSNLESVFALRSVDGNRYYKGGAITLRGVDCIA